MKQLLLVMLSFLFAAQASAACPQNISFGDIPFEKNSSYFDSRYAKQLQALIRKTQADSGYLLLEFPLYKGETDKKIRDYNLWLANRRIERVKTFLTKADYNQPVVTKLLTASKEDTRTLSLHWCQQGESETTIASTVDPSRNQLK
ncbi:hypothetical protein K0I63_04135 [Shewanella rhizosphaerae]|uniref:hypothetical protein n=1 Tax=Shewanella rhizosphaerae TaxID=2864207 RepID=UPI001C65F27D|nr:hypothetical protein [Shewanella rhizosphaerae]QYK13714.1 hypothetical protein K0I63_04135 [Shewanella rhizosphaerae]